MKIRKGFVSNSSSSSFVISTKGEPVILLSSLGGITLFTKEDLDKCWKDSDKDKTYELYLKEIREGRNISILDIDHNGYELIDGVIRGNPEMKII